MIYNHTHAENVVRILFEPDYRRLGKKLDDLIVQNNEVIGKSAKGFTFKGQGFMQTGHTMMSVDDRPPLDGSLWAKAEKYLADETKISNDMAKIRQALCLVFTYCHTQQDVADTLPDVMWKYLGLHDSKRVNPVGHGFAHRPIVLQQYLNTVELMKFYVAAELIY